MTDCNTLNCPTYASLIKRGNYYCSSCYIELFEPQLKDKKTLQTNKKIYNNRVRLRRNYANT